MGYCKGVCNNGLRCKRRCSTEFCSIHDYSILCGICRRHHDIHSRLRIHGCGHVFCHECLTKSILKNQWHEGFSTEDKLYCPECQLELDVDSWQKVTSLLVERNKLKRKIIYNTYLSHEMFVKIRPRVHLDYEYTFHELDALHRYHDSVTATWSNIYNFCNTEYVEKVYFEKINPGDWRHGNTREKSVYVFYLGDPGIKFLFQKVWKELVEYVFHPSRINFENLEDM